MADTFGFETTLIQGQLGQALIGKNGILSPRIKQLTKAALNSELANYTAENPFMIG